VTMLDLAVGLGRDQRLAAALFDVVADGIAVEAAVAEHLLGIVVNLLHQGRVGGHVVRLTGGDHDGDGQAFGVAAGVDLSGEAAARAAEGVPLNPPFPPAAQWCARMMVASNICRAVSDTSLPANASSMRSQMPLSAQRRNCR